MSVRIDHVEGALDQLRTWDMGDADADVSLAYAQVHATLALVEQQRIANLIAMSVNAARMVAEGTGSPDDYLALHTKLNPLIQEGLGL